MLFALLFILTNFASPAALSANQDDAGKATVLVTSFICLADPGNATLTEGTIPADCTPVAGVAMSITSDLDGGMSCETKKDGACAVKVSVGATVTAWQDLVLLSGTSQRQNPITTVVVDYTELTFVNLPIATAVPTDVPAQTPVPPTAEQPAVPTDVPVETTTRTFQTANTQVEQQDITTSEVPGGDVSTSLTPSPSATVTETVTVTATTTVTATSTTPATETATATATQVPTSTPVTPTPAPVTKTYATVANTGGAGLRCRTQPNTTSTIITVLADGTRLETRGAASSGWIPVTCANQSGWIYASYANTTTETTSPTSPTPTPPTTTTGTASVSNTGGSGLRCRASASTSAAIITVLAEGTKVDTRGSVTNGWLPVICAGKDGWIYAAYATINTTANPTPTAVPTTPPPSGTSGWGTVRNTGGGGLNCRSTASTSSSVITILAEGSTVETRGAAVNGWVPVKCASKDGWVSSSYFVVSTSGTAPTPTPTQAPSTGTGTYAMVSGTGYGGLNCRSGAGTTFGVITILPEGTRVETRGSVTNGWLPVKCAGQNGWVSASYVLLGVGAGGSTGAVWIEVDITRQYMRVYRGDTVIGETYVSTGRYGFDTPAGTFYTNWKLPSQTMTGVLGGEYYYVQDVPWVMYFTNRGHAIHGAYWHNNFGYRMSHGCVNLPVPFAKWLYEISPVGTRVWIHF